MWKVIHFTKNREKVLELTNEIRLSFHQKTIWLYTGFTWEQLIHDALRDNKTLYDLLQNIDVLVDGRYVDELRNIALKWRGSNNQRVIDVKKSLRKGQVVLYCD